MGKPALIICNEELVEEYSNGNMFKRFAEGIMRLFRKAEEKDNDNVDQIQLYENLSVLVLHLPWRMKEIENMEISRIERYLERIKAKFEIGSIYLPEGFLGNSDIEWCKKSVISERELFRCLLPGILEDFISESRNEMSELNISIIHGDDDQGLERIIAWLSPKVKYLTVITDRKEKAQGISDEAFEEYGLCIGLTGDYKSGLRNADIVINLADLSGLNTRLRTNPKAWVFNLGPVDSARAFGESKMIKGVRIRLPQSVLQQMGKEVMKYYKMDDIVRMILTERVSPTVKSYNFNTGAEREQLILSEFRKCGLSAAGHVGGHGGIHVGNT